MACKSKPFRTLLFILLFWACPALVGAVTPPVPAQPHEYVVDLAGVLDASAKARLNAELKDLEAQTTAQVVVLTLNSLEGEPIETFSHQTAVKWGIGQKGKDNGVLLTVAVKDHKYRIEVGYGLESTLPDSLVGSIGREYLVPNFKKGDFAAGIMTAVTEIVKNIAAGKTEKAAREGELPNHGETALKKEIKTGDQIPKILFFIFLAVLNVLFFAPRIWSRGKTKKRRGGSGFWFFGGGGGGGWSSGGGDSGFSGGGGDFGGGGASGDW